MARPRVSPPRRQPPQRQHGDRDRWSERKPPYTSPTLPVSMDATRRPLAMRASPQSPWPTFPIRPAASDRLLPAALDPPARAAGSRRTAPLPRVRMPRQGSPGRPPVALSRHDWAMTGTSGSRTATAAAMPRAGRVGPPGDRSGYPRPLPWSPTPATASRSPGEKRRALARRAPPPRPSDCVLEVSA